LSTISDFGLQLRRHGISPSTFADYCGMSHRHIRRIVSGARPPTIFHFAMLNKALGEIDPPERVIVLKIEYGIRHNTPASFSTRELQILKENLPVLFPIYGKDIANGDLGPPIGPRQKTKP